MKQVTKSIIYSKRPMQRDLSVYEIYNFEEILPKWKNCFHEANSDRAEKIPCKLQKRINYLSH